MRDPGSDLEHDQVNFVWCVVGDRQIIRLSELFAGDGAFDVGAKVGGKFAAAEVQNRATCHQFAAA